MKHLATQKQVFTAKKQKALTSLLSCPNLKEASEAAGCNRSSLYRYLSDPVFCKELNRLRFQQLNQAAGSLQKNSERAADILFELAEDKQCPASVRLSAARTILEAGIKFAETVNLEQRLTELEGEIDD